MNGQSENFNNANIIIATPEKIDYFSRQYLDLLMKVDLSVNPFGEDMVEFRVITSSQPMVSSILMMSAAKQVWKSQSSVMLSSEAEEEVEQGINGMTAVIRLAPERFMAEIARISSIMPSLMSLFSNDFIMKTLQPWTESRSWMPIQPSLNRLVMWRPRVVSRWVATSLPRIQASKAKTFKSVNSEMSGVRNILLMCVSNSGEGVS